ncbi:class I SAM-dependent methyltransferase [Candidatus Latescibacterota bacterium]
MEKKENFIGKAGVWVDSLWEDALSRWSVRSGQDKNYRWHVVHPAIVSILSTGHRGNDLRILDLGCGDGIILDDLKNRELFSDKGLYLGIDMSQKLIEKARDSHSWGNAVFLQGNLSDSNLAGKIIERGAGWDCVLSVFVIQEIPDCESFIENLSKVVEPDSLVVIITVHPDFAEWLKQNGGMKAAEDITSRSEPENPPWRWAGSYPIVDEPHDVFYLPYFHRTIEDYRSLFARFGMIIDTVLELPDKHNELPFLVEEGISPFTPFENNVYWPYIGEEPSALAIIARKETAFG